MSRQDPFSRYAAVCFYHFTDRRNIESIRRLGGLYSLAALEEMGVEIPVPGGNDWSHNADKMKGLDHFVHLSFRNWHPMEYRARKEGRIASCVYLEIDRKITLELEGLRFTPDVSNKRGIKIIPLEEASSVIDFEVLYTRMEWANPEVNERLQKAGKCELLVPNHVPMKYIRNLPNG